MTRPRLRHASPAEFVATLLAFAEPEPVWARAFCEDHCHNEHEEEQTFTKACKLFKPILTVAVAAAPAAVAAAENMAAAADAAAAASPAGELSDL